MTPWLTHRHTTLTGYGAQPVELKGTEQKRGVYCYVRQRGDNVMPGVCL